MSASPDACPLNGTAAVSARPLPQSPPPPPLWWPTHSPERSRPRSHPTVTTMRVPKVSLRKCFLLTIGFAVLVIFGISIRYVCVCVWVVLTCARFRLAVDYIWHSFACVCVQRKGQCKTEGCATAATAAAATARAAGSAAGRWSTFSEHTRQHQQQERGATRSSRTGNIQALSLPVDRTVNGSISTRPCALEFAEYVHSNQQPIGSGYNRAFKVRAVSNRWQRACARTPEFARQLFTNACAMSE